MSSMDENVDEGDRNGSSGVSAAVGISLAEASGYLRRFLESDSSRGAPNEDLVARLRSEDERLALADDILFSIAPKGIAGDVLYDWLAGGASPYEATKLKAANVERQSAPVSIDRVSKRVKRRQQDAKQAAAGVARAEAALAQAKEKLAVAEAEVEASKGYEGALVYYELAQHFGKTVAPLFAMGPAWTIMRSLSAHASDHALEMNCGLLVGKDREEAEAAYISARAAETEALRSTLDFFSGDALFEEKLRMAISDVCKDAEKRRPAAEKAGRRDRSKTKRKTEVHPKARADADEVIEGLRRAG